MKEIIKTAIRFLVSSRDYILYWVSNQRNISTQEAAYILIAIPAYLFDFVCFPQNISFVLSGSRKRKWAFYLAADTVLYEYQYQKAWEDLGWISSLQSASYMQSYSLLLEKASLLSEQTQKQLKKSYHAYKFSLKKRAIIAFLLVVFTLGAYKLFWKISWKL